MLLVNQLTFLQQSLNHLTPTQEELLQLQGEIKALEWVLNGSRTAEEKSADLPKASKEEVTKIIKNFNEQYKQLSLEDLGVQINEEGN